MKGFVEGLGVGVLVIFLAGVILAVTLGITGLFSGADPDPEHITASPGSIQVSQTAILKQIDETYVVTAGHIGGHVYLFVRLVGSDQFEFKHAAFCGCLAGGKDG